MVIIVTGSWRKVRPCAGILPACRNTTHAVSDPASAARAAASTSKSTSTSVHFKVMFEIKREFIKVQFII